MSNIYFDEPNRGNFRTARDLQAETASIEASARSLRAETTGRLASRVRRALSAMANAYLRGLSYSGSYIRPF